MKKRPKLKRRRDNPPAVEPVTNDVERGAIRARLQINKHDLDRELMEQPNSFGEVCDRLAHARSVRDQCKDALKTAEAMAYLEARAEFESKGEKITEKLLDAIVQISPKRREGFQQLVNAERELAEWEGMRDVWRDRGFMIRELANLHVAAYFQTNSAGHVDFAQRDMRAERNRTAMAEQRSKQQRKW